MKRTTAIKNANRIAEKLMSVCGIICTQEAVFDAVRVKRAWVFGSTAKGSAKPNDLDILVEMKVCGKFQRGNAKRVRGLYGRVCWFDAARRFIRDGMKMVRIHDYDIEKGLGDIISTAILIYPRNDLSTHG